VDISQAIEQGKAEIRIHANEAHASIQKAYLKVPYPLIGHRVPQLRAAARAVRKACPKPSHGQLIAALDALWRSDLYEDKLFSILLAGYFEKYLTLKDARTVCLTWARSLMGWSLLDGLASDVMGRIALREPALFEDSAKWVSEPSFWVRRAALLIHLPAIRAHELRFDILRRTAEAMVDEREFFITKAMGWVLREMFDRMPLEAEKLYVVIAPRAAALTKREALRKLEPEIRERLQSVVMASG